jgi:hypothetical protein
MKQPKRYLFTANPDVSSSFLQGVEKRDDVHIVHFSLEKVKQEIIREEEQQILEKLDEFTFILYGNLRNAKYLISWVDEKDLLEAVRQKIHICHNQAVMDLLEDYNIPGIMPREDARPIDMIEFLLRISREGAVLYPTEEQKGEELPGLLQELEIPVAEFTVCREVPLQKEELKKFRRHVDERELDGVIFHSRSSVTRTLTAFPDLKLQDVEVVSSGHAVTEKLEEAALKADLEAQSTWRSLLQIL